MGARIGHRPTRRIPTSALLVVLLAVLLLPRTGSAQSPIDGELGLWVTDVGGEIGVGWLTSESGAGHVRVWAGDEVFVDVDTPPSGAHYVTFPNPHRDVDVAYGLAGRALFGSKLFLAGDPPVESGELEGVDSLYVVGDVHGEYAHLRDLLVNAGLVDRSGMRWTGGKKHVVFVGDLFDRGPDVTPVLWLLYRLEHEARAAGGGSHVVLGNHETMVFTGDLVGSPGTELEFAL